MVTQKIVTRLSNDVLPPVRMVSGDVGREIQLEIYANDESLAPIDLETYSARITIIKPDNTFVIKDFDNDKVELPEQAGAVTGHGYYQIKIYTAGDHKIYTGQGPFIVDDDVLSKEMIESVAEVNGYEFPDDFLTDTDLREYVTKYELEDALAGIIDDDTTDYNSTWSSAKISDALTPAIVTKTATGNPIEISDGADAPLVKCVTAITGSQSGSGTPSPDNVRPIVAYTEGEIEVSDGNGNTTTHTTTYPSAIYRGSEDVVNGTVECVKKKITISSGIQLYGNYGVDNAPLYYYDTTSDIAPYYNSSNPIENRLISNCYNATTGIDEGRLGDFEFRTNANPIGSANRFYFRDSRFTTAADFNAWIANNPIEIVYSVYAPTSATVTPTNLPIKSLSGYSHIESTTGKMEVEYITQTYQPLVDLIQSSQHVYSTQEQIVGKWVDGSTLYEITKTYTVSELRVGDWTQLEDLSNLGIDTLLPITGKMHLDTTNQQMDAGYYLRFNYQNGILYFYTSETMPSTGSITVVLRYTKTSSNNHSLSKGATDSMKADFSEEKKEIEELPETEEKTVKTAKSEGEI